MTAALGTNLRAAKVLLRLLPSVIALRRDRRKWAASRRGRSRRGGDGGDGIDRAAFESHARRMLDTLVSLGPVYIKLGQWLSSRGDILPHPYLGELAKLQDEVPAAPFEEVRHTLERSIGPLNRTLDGIETDAISGASIGQVYRATYGGRQIAIKVKRPGIEDAVERDLAVIKRILPPALRFVDPNLRHSARAMLAQFVESVGEEMDYTLESENLKAIRHNMASDTSGATAVVVPPVIDELSSRDVLAMEYIPGIKITDIPSLDKRGIDRQKLVVDVHKVFFTMLLRHSIFHADPHPGNISVTDDGRLIIYDYGMVGRLDGDTRMRLIRLYLAMVEKDPARTVSAMDDLGMLVPDSNRELIERAVEVTVRAMHGRRPDEMEVESLIELANRTMSRFPFVLPKNLALYMRMASIIEGIYKTHEVDFKFVGVLREVLEEEQLVRDAYAEEIKRTVARLARSVDAAISIAPELKRHLAEARSARYAGRSRPGSGLALLSGSVLAGSAFVGSAVLYSSSLQPDSTVASAGAAGMAGALAVMCALAIALWRRGQSGRD